MGLTKTDFMSGLRCPKLLWLSRHKSEYRITPPSLQKGFDAGHAFGDSIRGLFGDYALVEEFYPGTTHPEKEAMAKKTKELLEKDVPVICEAAFMDGEGNYCAVDLLRRIPASKDRAVSYEMYEAKNSNRLSTAFIIDAAFQALLIRRTGLPLTKVFIILRSGAAEYDETDLLYPGEIVPLGDASSLVEITGEIEQLRYTIEQNTLRLNAVKLSEEEPDCGIGTACSRPSLCQFYDYCHARS